jgi:hypothetical protein
MQHSNNTSNWKHIRQLITPLDMMFFHGGEIVSKMIDIMERLTTGSGEYTHIGICVNDQLLPNAHLDHDTWYVWESTFSSAHVGSGDVKIVGTEGGHFGPQLRKLDEVVPAYLSKHGTKMALGKLRNNPWNDILHRERLIKKFGKAFEMYNNITYDYNPKSLLGSMIKPLRTHNNKLFCSELVAAVYVKIGVLSSNVDPSGVVPMDFLGHDRDHEIPSDIVEEVLLIQY